MKWLSWLAKTTLAAIVFSVVSLYATWTAVQTYVDRIASHYKLDVDLKSVGFSDFVANMGRNLNILNQPASQKKDSPEAGLAATPANGSVSGAEAGAVGSTGNTGNTNNLGNSGSSGGQGKPGSIQQGNVHQGATSTPGASGNGSSLNGREEKDGAAGSSGKVYPEGMADALPVWNQSGSSQAQGSQSGREAEKQTILSSESVTATKDKMSNEDKMKLFSLLVSKLPPAEVQTISKLMEDGITREELEEINTIIRKYMTESEYNQMVAILEKYQ